MVSRALRTFASAALAAGLLAGCSAEFGGRCADTTECESDRLCIQGYCLPPDSPDRFADGGMADGGDGGVLPDGASGGGGCDAPGPTPAYDEDLRPCADEHTAALWRFDDGFEAEVPPGATPVMLKGMPDGDRVRIGPGIAGNAAIFDGGDDPQLDVTEPLRATPPLTIELWARLAGQGDDSRPLVSNLDTDGDADIAGGFELAVDQLSGDPTQYQLGFVYAVERRRETFETAATFPAGVWVHLAATVDEEGRVRLYVDGVEETFGTMPTEGRGRDLVFGRRAEGEVRPYPGALDEVRLSTIARDAASLQRVARDFARPE